MFVMKPAQILTDFSDGVLTPAQSVLGAIQGIRVASPDISTCK
jgi:K+ transporter